MSLGMMGLPATMENLMFNQEVTLRKRTLTVEDAELGVVAPTYTDHVIHVNVQPIAYSLEALTLGGEINLGSAILVGKPSYRIVVNGQEEDYSISKGDRILTHGDNAIQYRVTRTIREFPEDRGTYIICILIRDADV